MTIKKKKLKTRLNPAGQLTHSSAKTYKCGQLFRKFLNCAKAKD
jgi:hypothetical protein